MNWELVPKKGLSSGEFSISFGCSRGELREALGQRYPFSTPRNFPDEDDFENESTFIRVRYDDEDRVQDIEFLGGRLYFEGIPLHGETTFAEIASAFEARYLTFRDTQWFGEGMDCVELEISIATREDVGGDGDGIEWVILSSDLDR